MSAEPGGAYAVVVGVESGLRPDLIARALAAFRGVPVPDAAMAVRRARGILAEDLDGKGAEALLGRLAAAGVAARALPASALAVLPPVLLLGWAAPEPGALRIVVRGREERAVPWERLRLVAVAPFTETVFQKVKSEEGPSGKDMAMRAGLMAVTGLPISIGGSKKVVKMVPKSEFHLYLDLLLQGPAERLRVDTGRFDYSGLGEKMAYAAHANARALLEAVVAAAPGAARSPGADLLLGGGRLASLGYASLADFEREERWLLTVVP
jgi:hypothetical protein